MKSELGNFQTLFTKSERETQEAKVVVQNISSFSPCPANTKAVTGPLESSVPGLPGLSPVGDGQGGPLTVPMINLGMVFNLKFKFNLIKAPNCPEGFCPTEGDYKPVGKKNCVRVH